MSIPSSDWTGRRRLRLMSIIERAAPGFHCTLHDYTALCHRHHLVTPQGELLRRSQYRDLPRLRRCRQRSMRLSRRSGRAARRATAPFSHRPEQRLRPVARRRRAARARLSECARRSCVRMNMCRPRIAAPPRRRSMRTLRVAVIGAISLHKGARLLHALALDAEQRELPISFRIIGSSVLRKELEDARRRRDRPLWLRRCGAGAVSPTGARISPCSPPSGRRPTATRCRWRWRPAFRRSSSTSARRRSGCATPEQGHILDLALAEAPAALNDALLALPLDALWKKRRRFAPRSYPRLVEDYYGLEPADRSGAAERRPAHARYSDLSPRSHRRRRSRRGRPRRTSPAASP